MTVFRKISDIYKKKFYIAQNKNDEAGILCRYKKFNHSNKQRLTRFYKLSNAATTWEVGTIVNIGEMWTPVVIDKKREKNHLHC